MGEGLGLTRFVVGLGLGLVLGLQQVVGGLGLWTGGLGGGLDLVLGLVVLGQGLERGEGGLVRLEGLKGRKKGLGSVGLLGRVDDLNLVLEVLRWGLWGHVVDVVDLRSAGVVVGLLD